MQNKMELINRLSRKQLTEDEVYTFNITLCDNEVDRDYEAFSIKALEEMGKLFVGKTGISDHSMRSSDQAARIYNAWVETDFSRKTTYGESYTALRASAYMVRTSKNEDLIKEIDGGIKKEVSVGCAVSEHICSVCGKPAGKGGCNHLRGKVYNGKTCYHILSGVTDAYEWSFVAVPAQREAGVTKSFKAKERNLLENPKELFKSAKEDMVISKAQSDNILRYIEQLEEKASLGESYRQELIKEVKTLAALTLPEVPQKAFEAVCEDMSIETLKQFRTGLEKKKSTVLPVTPQLFTGKENNSAHNNSEYRI
ncbi:MAG: hypothetical protein IJO24_02840 [Clostridia bacterium]|nr:hypothetical protein [Clostridia bacterium]